MAGFLKSTFDFAQGMSTEMSEQRKAREEVLECERAELDLEIKKLMEDNAEINRQFRCHKDLHRSPWCSDNEEMQSEIARLREQNLDFQKRYSDALGENARLRDHIDSVQKGYSHVLANYNACSSERDRLCEALQCAVEGLEDFKLGHTHNADDKHYRPMGDRNGFTRGEQAMLARICEWLTSEEAEDALPKKPGQFPHEVCWASARDWAKEIRAKFGGDNG